MEANNKGGDQKLIGFKDLLVGQFLKRNWALIFNLRKT
jgi:hypothetical protein